MEIRQFFKEKTNNFSYFRFLCTGKSYRVGELCFIGDTGWTSFKRDGKKVSEYYGAAEPPVRCGESHLSGLTEPLRSL